MVDTETLIDPPKQEDKRDDFPSMGFDLIKKINFKMAFFLLLIGFFLFSDMFVNMLPSNYKDEIGGCTNTKGTFLQLFILVITYICVDVLIQGDVL